MIINYNQPILDLKRKLSNSQFRRLIFSMILFYRLIFNIVNSNDKNT